VLAKTLIDRARDLAEALKVHRIPSADHVVISLLIEPLQNRKSFIFPSAMGIINSIHVAENPDDPLGKQISREK